MSANPNSTPSAPIDPNLENVLKGMSLKMVGLQKICTTQELTIQEQGKAIAQLTTNLTSTLEALKTLTEKVVANTEKTTDFQEQVSNTQKAVSSFDQEQMTKNFEDLLTFVENMVKDLQDGKDADLGANMVAFNPLLAYDGNTVGGALKKILKALSLEPTFFNLGAPKEVMANETITVNQTNIKLINPKDVLLGYVKNIEGGEEHDTVLLSSRGTITLTTDGNLKLASEFDMEEGSVIALRKSKSVWVEIWRNPRGES